MVVLGKEEFTMLKSNSKRIFVFSLLILILLSLSAVSASEDSLTDTISNDQVTDVDVSVDSSPELNSTLDLEVNSTDTPEDENITNLTNNIKEISKETITEDDSVIENLEEEIDEKVKSSILSADGDEILYISPTGSATASGTRDDPLNSINSALSMFTGDGSHTIVVMDGTYTGLDNSLVNSDLDNLNIIADDGANPLFNLYYSYGNPLYWVLSGNNIHLDGLNFACTSTTTSSYVDGQTYYFAVLRFVNSTNVLVENCAMDKIAPYKFNVTNSDNVSFKNCSFSNSTSSYYMFASENSNFTIEDSNLTNISTSSIVNSTFKLINNTFSNINNSNLFNVKNSSAEIINNTVKDSYFSGSYGFFQIRDDIETNISFVGNNFTNLTGYDLINSNSNQHVPRNIVIANNSFSDVRLGINAQYANLTVENNTFKNMSSSSNSYPTVFSQYGNLSFKNNNYTDSSSLIRVYYSNGTIDNNNFLNNVPNYTGIIYSYGSNLNISGNNFTNNSGNNNSISINNGNYTINDNIFKDNNGSGHEVYVSYYDTNLDLYDNVFKNNTGVNGSVYLMGNASVHNNNFTHNNASLGAAIYINYNNSWNNYYNNSIKVYDNNFDSNNASYGGAIYYVDYYYDSGIKDIYNNTFTNNTALKGGAIFSNQSKNATFEGNEFINNSADMGGAIYIDYEYYSNSFRYNNSNNAIKDNKFIDNTAQSGGAVVFYTTNSTVEGNEFISNNATRYGGGALVTSGNNTPIINNTFINNTAMLYAGAIGTNDSDIIGNTFKDNSAYQAGAILTINSTIKNNTFDGNNATRGPAVVYIDSNNYTVPVCNCENCTDCNMTNCTCENCNITDETIPLLDDNEGLDFDKDVYVYHDDHVLNVVQDLNGMYYLYEGANVTKADEYYYWAYCIEKNNSHPWLNNGTHGILVEDLYFVRNSLDGSYVGDYLKILISYCYHNLDEDIINVKDYIYIFTDTDYRNSSDRIVKKIIQIAGNEDTVLENGNNWINGAWNCLEFYTFINPTTRQNLILTNSCMPLDKPDFNVTKRANKDMVSTGEIVNYTIVVTNNGTTNLHGITVSERPESMLIYVSFNDYKHQGWIQTGDLTWTLNRTLRVNQTAEFVVNFRVNQVTSHTFINNQLEVRSNETNIKNTTEKIETRYPQLQTTKVALDPIARPNSGIRFLLLVKNIGTETAYNVSIGDSYSTSQLTYINWAPYKGSWSISNPYSPGNIRFYLIGSLSPGQEAGVYINFRTGNITGTTIYNYLYGYLNNTQVHSSSNFTRIPAYALAVEKSVVGPNENITVGDEVTYAIVVRNTAEGNLTNVHVDDYIPDGLQYLRFYNTDGHNWTYYEMPDGTHRFTLKDTLYNSQVGTAYSTARIYIVCRAIDIGKLNNIATAKGDYTNNATDDENVTIIPYGFRVEKLANNLSSQVGDQISFTIRVTNTGILPLTGVKVDEIVSEYMVYDHFVDASKRWTYNGNNQWVLNGSLNVSDYSQFDVFYNVTNVPGNGVLVNTIVVGTNETGNKTAHNQTDIYNLSITKISNNPESRVGDQISFTIVVRYDYSGTSTKDHLNLDGIFIKDLIPDGLVYDHFEDNSSKWSYDSASDTWNYNGKLAPNNQLNLTLYFNVTKKDNIVNVVIGGANHTHNVTANNSTNSFHHSMLIEKITLNETVFVGDITEFIINVTNNGDSDLSNVRVREVIPEGLEYIDYSNKTGNWTFVNSADGPVWTYEGILAPGEFGEFIVRFNATGPGTFVNIVYGVSNETKEIEAENLTKVYNPHMIVQKITLNESVYRGDLSEFRIVLVNDGDYDLTEVSIEEIIPEGLSYYGFVDESGKWSYDEENHRFNYDGIFAKREVLQFVVVFNTTKAGNFTNNVVARSNETEDQHANNTTEVHENDFNISKISNNKTVIKGDKVEFTISITNVGECDLRELYVEESSFEGLKYVGYLDESGKWFNNGLQWVYDGALAPGETTNFTVIFEATELGNLTNIVVAHSYHTENKSANNTTEVVLADVGIQKIALNETVLSGEQTLFEIVVVNKGIVDLDGVVVTDKFPDGLAYSSFIDESGKWSNEGNKWYYNDILNPGESASFIVVFDTNKAGTFRNIVTVESSKTLNKSTSNITEVVVADISIQKITLNRTVYSGNQTRFMIVVTNNGTVELSEIVVTDEFPDGLTYSSFIDKTGKWSNEGNKWYYNGTLKPGESASFIVVFDTNKTGNYTNVVYVVTNKVGPRYSSNITEVIRKIVVPPGNRTPPVPHIPGKPVIPTNPDKPKLVPHNPSVLSDIKAGNPIALLFISITLLGIIPLGMNNNEETRRSGLRRKSKARKIKEPKEIDKKKGIIILSVCLLAIVSVSAISAADTGDLGYDEPSGPSVSYEVSEPVQDSYSTNEVYITNEYDYEYENYVYSAGASSDGSYYAYDEASEEYIVVEGNSSYSVNSEVVYVDGEESNMNTYGPNSIYSADDSSAQNVEYDSSSDYISSVSGYQDSTISNEDNKAKSVYMASALSADDDAVIYVSPSGTSSGTGTVDDPVSTIQIALNRLNTVTGTKTIIVKDGVYSGLSNIGISTSLNNLIIKADEGAKPVFNLTYSGNVRNVFWKFMGQNISISGLNFVCATSPYVPMLNFTGSSGVSVSNCIFSDSRSAYQIGLNKSDAVFTNCTFTNGTSRIFSVYNSNISIVDSNISNSSTSYFRNSTFELINSTVSNFNTDGIFNFADSNLTVVNNTFKDLNFPNKVNWQRFGLFYSSDNVAGMNYYFANNTFANMTGEDAYLLYIYYYRNNMTRNITFENNNVSNVLVGIQFDYANVTMVNNTFDHIGPGNHSAISIRYSNITIVDNNFTNNNYNKTYNSEGAPLSVYNSRGIIQNNNFTDNIGRSSGGALAALGGVIDISNNTFANNTALASAGAIRGSGNLTIHNNTFLGNNGTSGALYLTGNSLVYNNSFVDNNGTNGTLYISSNATVYNNSFVNNTVSNRGGAILASYDSTFSSYYKYYANITENIFDGNSAEYGGAIYYENYRTYSTIKELVNNTYINNYADFGGAIFTNKTSNTTIADSDFINNSARIGGAIFIDYPQNYNRSSYDQYNNTNVTIKDNNFIDNSAQSAGAVVVYSKDSVIENNNFTGNNATRYGGGALVSGGANNTIFNNSFENNSAMLYAGAIGTNNSLIINNTFNNNSAYQAGAILSINSSIENNTFDGNTANRASAIAYVDNYDYNGTSLVNNNTGLDIDEDVYAYDESSLLRVALNNNDMYFLYNNASVTLGDNYTYWAYCIEENNSKPWLNNGTDGILVEDMYFIRNSLDGSYVGDYLKVLVSYFYLNILEDEYNLKDYRNNDSRIIKRIINLTESPDTYLENGNNWINGVWNCLEFYSFINPTTRQNLILINSCSPMELPDFSAQKDASKKLVNAGDIVNYTVTVYNNGTVGLHNVTVTEMPNSMLTYVSYNDYLHQGWVKSEDNLTWVLNRTLRPHETGKFVINFQVGQFSYLMNITNVIQVSSNEKSTKVFEEKVETKWPRLEVQKITLDTNVTPGSPVRFLLLVKNTGTLEAHNVTLIDRFDKENLDYMFSWAPYIGNWYGGGGTHWSSSNNYKEIGAFYLNQTLYPGEQAGVIVYLKVLNNTTAYSAFNTVLANATNVSTISITNYTQIVRPSMGVYKRLDSPTTGATIGEEVTFAINVYNRGGVNLTGVYVNDIIPYGLEYLRFYTLDNTNWTHLSQADGTHRFMLNGTLTPYSVDYNHYQSTLYIVCRATELGNHYNVAVAGSDLTNETWSQANVTVIKAGMRVEKISLNPISAVGDMVSYKIRVTNIGQENLTGTRSS